MTLSDRLAAGLGSRVLLGLCALVLAGSALRGEFDNTRQVNDQSAEQECRDRLDAALIDAMAVSLQRIELAFAALSQGNEEAQGIAVQRTIQEKDAYDDARFERANAVVSCREG